MNSKKRFAALFLLAAVFLTNDYAAGKKKPEKEEEQAPVERKADIPFVGVRERDVPPHAPPASAVRSLPQKTESETVVPETEEARQFRITAANAKIAAECFLAERDASRRAGPDSASTIYDKQLAELLGIDNLDGYVSLYQRAQFCLARGITVSNLWDSWAILDQYSRIANK